jgi:uncharacterized damage-inducible protein DinB
MKKSHTEGQSKCQMITKFERSIVALALLLVALPAIAQQKPSTPSSLAAKIDAKDEKAPETAANPVTTTVRQLVDRQSKNIIAAAEEMPAEKYDYHPTEGQMSFAHLISHIIESNNFLCAKISDQMEPKAEVKDADGKAKLVPALKASFDYCAAALEKTNDAKLGDTVTLYRGRQAPRAAAVIGLTNDFADHYGAAAMYLRLNGLLPPTAQKK